MIHSFISFFPRKFNLKMDSKIWIWLYLIQQNIHSSRKPGYRTPLYCIESYFEFFHAPHTEVSIIKIGQLWRDTSTTESFLVFTCILLTSHLQSRFQLGKWVYVMVRSHLFESNISREVKWSEKREKRQPTRKMIVIILAMQNLGLPKSHE